MTVDGDLELVIRLACETEDRSPEEQDALLRTAARLDNRLNAQVVTNHRSGPPSDLLVHAARTVDPSSDGAGRRLPAKAQETWRKRHDGWLAR